MLELTQDEIKFLKNQYQAFLKTEELNVVVAARVVEEQALAVEYKIDEANTKRAALVEKYKNLEVPLRAEINEFKSNKK